MQLLAVAAYGDVKIDLPENYTHFEDNKKPEFLSKFPLGKIPAWEGKDGFLLTEALAIARYSTCTSFVYSFFFRTPQVGEKMRYSYFQLSLS